MAAAHDAMIAFPMKYLSAGALCFNQQGELLIVKPTYKDDWEIPGGIVEADESPIQACRREVREELGLDLPVGPLLAIDYYPRQGERPDSLQFVFSGGVLTPAEIAAIRLPADELSGYRFVAPDQTRRLLRPTLSRCVNACVRALAERRTLVLHAGHEA
jgi:8-oxo-dGTP pyrophosphatase MutT (NUDIX family)